MLTVKDIKDAKERADKLAHPMFVVVSPISGMETAADQICKVLNYVVVLIITTSVFQKSCEKW